MDWKTLTSLGRFEDIVMVLLRYGFDDLVDRLNIPGTKFMRNKSPIDQPLNTFERIRYACEELGPTFVKFGQMASLRPDLVPPPLIDELGKLQDDVAPVDKLIIGPENITGTLKGSTGQAFKTIRVDDPGLAKELDERNISYSGQYDNKFLGSLLSWVLPLGFFYLIWRFAMKKMGSGMGVMSFSKIKAFDAETPWPAKEGNIN